MRQAYAGASAPANFCRIYVNGTEQYLDRRKCEHIVDYQAVVDMAERLGIGTMGRSDEPLSVEWWRLGQSRATAGYVLRPGETVTVTGGEQFWASDDYRA